MIQLRPAKRKIGRGRPQTRTKPRLKKGNNSFVEPSLLAQFTPRIQDLIAIGKVKVYNLLREFYDRKS